MSLRQKKIILWSVTIVISLVLFYWWVGNARERIKNFKMPEINVQEIIKTK